MITEWDQLGLTFGVPEIAQVLDVGVRTIEKRLAAGVMWPAPLPRVGREPWKWSKAKVRAALEGPASVRRHRAA